METSDLRISKDSLLEVLSRASLDSASFSTCDWYSSQFGGLPLEDDTLRHAANFLTRMCSMRLLGESSSSEFALAGTTWTELEYSEEQLCILVETVESIQFPELRSRVHDVLWIRLRRVVDAIQAAKFYIDAGEKCLNAGSPGAGIRFGRAMQLALTVDKQREFIPELVKKIESNLQRPDTPDFLLAESIDELLTRRAFDPDTLLRLAIARSQTTQNSLAERRLCDLVNRCAIRLGDSVAAKKSLMQLASSFEREADQAEIKVIAIALLKSAIQTLRRVAGTHADRDRVQSKMLKIQDDLATDFKSVQVASVDLSKNDEDARLKIRGKGKFVALAELVRASSFHDSSKAAVNAESTIRAFPFQNMFAVEKFGSTFKSATAIPPTDIGGISDERLFYAMITEYECLFGVVSKGTIEPMIHELNLCHHLTISDVAEFVYRSPYIPVGHHEFFCIGLLAGIQGRMIEALHCLVPQLEMLIRSFLWERDIIVSSVDQKGNQREFDLTRLLEMPETVEHISKDVVTTLKVLFTHQAGPNIRNELAHGMLTGGQFSNANAIYAWWTIVWFALHPVAELVLEQANTPQKSDDDISSPNRPEEGGV